MKMEELEMAARELGRAIKGTMPEGVGFTLFLFEYGESGKLTYISTAQRADMVRVIEEWLEKVKHGN